MTSTAPMASGNQLPSDHDEKAKPVADKAKADSKPDRQSRSLVRDLPVGEQRPASGKTAR